VTSHPRLHCVVIGYHDIDFDKFAYKQKQMEGTAAGYHEVKANSIFLNGRRCTYMDTINYAVERAQGKNPRLNVFEAPSLGAFYLASFLHQKGLNAAVVNFFNYDQKRLAELLAQSPDAVAITTTFYIDCDPITEIVKFVRKLSPRTKVIVGGPHIFNSVLDHDAETLEFLFQEMGADIYIVDSQGEGTLAQVVECLSKSGMEELKSIPNLYFSTNRLDFTPTPRVPENNDLDESTIDWTLFDPSDISPVAYLRTARSCPFSCSFCNYPTMAGAHVVTQVEAIERQLRYLSSIGTTDLVFVDDTFNVPLPRFKKILRMMIANRFNFRWISFFRCSNADDEAFTLMKESGCVGVFLGIESGDEQILKYMNKAATVDRYKWGIQRLHEQDIATFASIICGFPGETEGSVHNSLRFIEETRPDFFNVQLYYHDMRSPIQKRASEFQLTGAGYNWRHRGMDWKEATDWVKFLYQNINNSGALTLYGFSLWAVPYLLSKGISLHQVKDLSYAIKPLLLKSLSENPVNTAEEEEHLVRVFRGAAPVGSSRPVMAQAGVLMSSTPVKSEAQFVT
jgi:radical SAM PhpK family P-methyltransferase